jgi:aspartate ammonia-lyase
VTALNPHLGYERSAEIAKEALRSGRPVTDIVLEKGYMNQTELDDLLKPENMTRPRYFRRDT